MTGCDTPSPPTRVVWEKLPVFNALEAWFYRKSPFFRNLEAKFLKTENLYGPILEMEPGVMPRVHAENTPLRTCPETSERNHGRNMRRDLLPIA